MSYANTMTLEQVYEEQKEMEHDPFITATTDLQIFGDALDKIAKNDKGLHRGKGLQSDKGLHRPSSFIRRNENLVRAYLQALDTVHTWEELLSM